MPKIVADMHIPPAFRRWGARLGLALLIAIAIGYVPGQVLGRDPRAEKLEAQLEELMAEAKVVAARNAVLRREIAALRSDVGAIEDRARADLGMVYPDEVVLRLPQAPQARGGRTMLEMRMPPDLREAREARDTREARGAAARGAGAPGAPEAP